MNSVYISVTKSQPSSAEILRLNPENHNRHINVHTKLNSYTYGMQARAVAQKT